MVINWKHLWFYMWNIFKGFNFRLCIFANVWRVKVEENLIICCEQKKVKTKALLQYWQTIWRLWNWLRNPAQLKWNCHIKTVSVTPTMGLRQSIYEPRTICTLYQERTIHVKTKTAVSSEDKVLFKRPPVVSIDQVFQRVLNKCNYRVHRWSSVRRWNGNLGNLCNNSGGDILICVYFAKSHRTHCFDLDLLNFNSFLCLEK